MRGTETFPCRLGPILWGWGLGGWVFHPNDGVIIKYGLFVFRYILYLMSNMTHDPKKIRRARFLFDLPSRKDHIAAGNDIPKVFRRK